MVHPHGEITDSHLVRGPEIRRITTPTLVIQGILDQINPPPYGRRLADLVVDARLLEIPVSAMGYRARYTAPLPPWCSRTPGDTRPPE